MNKTLRDGAMAAGVQWETLRTWIKRGWVILPDTTATGRPLVAGSTRTLDAFTLKRLRTTRKLITIGIHPREAWACSGVLDLATLADLEQAVTLAAGVRAAIYQKGAIKCRD